MFVPRKPHPFGNECDRICCGLSNIMFGIDLVEGKDAPKEKQIDQVESICGQTCASSIRLTNSVQQSGRVAMLDSGFLFYRDLWC